MGFEHLWPLLFLAFVPGIVLLYLLKQKVQTKKVPALNLWQEAFESVQASTPWEKFRNHLLMYLQIAVLLLLVFAMLMPYIIMTLEKLKIDPAIATGPFIAITNDIIGMMLYMGITVLLS